MSSDSTASATVNITILDINDHLPLFEQPFYQVNISELTEINRTVAILMATDRDEVHVTSLQNVLRQHDIVFQEMHATFGFTLVYNVTDYELLPFAVTSETVHNTGIAEITLTHEIDFENQRSYSFRASPSK